MRESPWGSQAFFELVEKNPEYALRFLLLQRFFERLDLQLTEFADDFRFIPGAIIPVVHFSWTR